MRQLLQNPNLAHDLGHPGGVAADLIPLDQLDGDLEQQQSVHIPSPRQLEQAKTYLDATFLFPPELDLAEFTLADGVAENVLAELGMLLSLRVIMPTPSAAARLLAVVNRSNDRGWDGVIFVVVVGHVVVRLSHFEAFSFPLNVLLGLRDDNAVENFARLSGRSLGGICCGWR